MNYYTSSLDRVGSVGALIVALAAPCCLPLFATFSGAIGGTVLGLSESGALYLLQGFALLALAGLAVARKRHHLLGPLLLGAASTLALILTLQTRFSPSVVYLGLASLCAASVWNYFLLRGCKMKTPGLILRSVITCPQCGHRAEETMPTNACWFFYECSACSSMLKPQPGHCCVFCSFGSVPCPPIQEGSDCCL